MYKLEIKSCTNCKHSDGEGFCYLYKRQIPSNLLDVDNCKAWMRKQILNTFLEERRKAFKKY